MSLGSTSRGIWLSLLKRPLIRRYSNNIGNESDKPVKFFGGAASRRAVVASIRKEVNVNVPWYQPISVVTSVAVFLIYFCVLREENDVDQEFNKTLYDRIKGLEKQQLLISYQYNKENGISVAEIEARLRELEAIESANIA